MGRPDALTTEYMSDNAHFADIFNYYLYDGKPVIRPENLREKDRTTLALPYGDKAEKSDAIQKYRDVFKVLASMEDDNAEYLLLGVEDQTNVHYAMPAKNMLYDAANYVMQVDKTAKEHKKKNDLKGAGYLEQFSKDDKLLPVITLVIYWSPDEWDGPRSIHEMFAVNHSDVLKFVSDYRINLISPREIDDKDFEKFETKLAEVLQFVKYSKNKKELKERIDSDPDYKHLDRRDVELINEVTGARIKIPEGAKEVNMCVAIREIEKEAVDNDRLALIKNLMDSMKMTAEQAMNALKISAEEQSRLLKML